MCMPQHTETGMEKKTGPVFKGELRAITRHLFSIGDLGTSEDLNTYFKGHSSIGANWLRIFVRVQFRNKSQVGTINLSEGSLLEFMLYHEIRMWGIGR